MQTYPYHLQPLPYAYDALEPYIGAETMYYHHDRHLRTYIENLNTALEPYPRLQALPLSTLLSRPYVIPKNARVAIERNGGGVYNHTMFFNLLKPPGECESAGMSWETPERSAFKNELTKAALGVFGSGYAWLVQTQRGNMRVMETANQETPLPYGYKPLLLIDVWEHAYYLQYKNMRSEYLDNIWNVIEYPGVSQL